MRHDKLEMQLQLMLALSQNNQYTAEQLCERFSISRRNFYYYIEFFRDCGFIVEKRGKHYCIDRESPFFRQLIERISFTEDEAVTLLRILNKVNEDALVRNIRQKLNRFYDFDVLNDAQLVEQRAQALSALSTAIRLKRMVVLKDYSSGHSKTVRDRLVEPFMLMNGNRDVRCYEPSSGMNKTFRLSRMKQVELLSDEWENEKRHVHLFIDAFMFSSEHPVTVTLRLDTLSANVLREEYPSAAVHMNPDGDSHFLLRLPVAGYQGIGRFVMGLFENIEVLGDNNFKAYLRDKISAMHNHFS